ncbi:hypothetical protein CXF70_08685 [Planomicrobium sp. MB-3u-38]|nr:hypothetical protein CXF70_08685 [Planomicrobium sp. MB-3u-38]
MLGTYVIRSVLKILVNNLVYIKLTENYEVRTVDDWIIKHYAINNSIKRMLEDAEEIEITSKDVPLNREYIVSVINSRVVKNELHRIVRLGYRQKIRPNKRSARYPS